MQYLEIPRNVKVYYIESFPLVNMTLIFAGDISLNSVLRFKIYIDKNTKFIDKNYVSLKMKLSLKYIFL